MSTQTPTAQGAAPPPPPPVFVTMPPAPTQTGAQTRQNYLQVSLPLYQAALEGDWTSAEIILRTHPNSLRQKITEQGDRVLHVAAGARRTAFVKELIKNMNANDLKELNNFGNTALCFAATSGVVEIAKEMYNLNQQLPLITGTADMTPLYMAALLGHRDMVAYLYSVTPILQLTTDKQLELLVATTHAGMYDIALDILRKRKELATKRAGVEKTALHVLATKKSMTTSLWTRCLCFCLHKGLTQQEAQHLLVQELWGEILPLTVFEITNLITTPPILHEAAEVGNIKFLVYLIRSYPDLIWQVDEENLSIFHVAVIHRQKKVFGLIYEIGSIKDLLLMNREKDTNNNILHLAALLPHLSRLNIVSGAALQMQHELLWFEEVKKLVWPSFMKQPNSDGKMPDELFTEQHAKLREDGEKWMKETATSCMLVATLIATVVFAAAFTVPGSYNSTTGFPVLLQEGWFLVFFISDAVGLVSSTTSIVTFLSILTSRYREKDFLVSLPLKLMCGFITLLASIASMSLAFAATFFLVYQKDKGKEWVPKFITASASIPVAWYAWLHVGLWLDTIWSISQSIFFLRVGKMKLLKGKDSSLWS